MNRRISLVHLVVALAAVFVLGGQSEMKCTPDEPEETACTEPLDCEGLPHILCVGEWECVGGACSFECEQPDPEPVPGCCNSDDDCGKGTQCVGDVCETIPAPGKCWSDADCAPGEQCWGKITCPCMAQCFAASKPGECIEPAKPACYADSDCGFLQECSIINDCCSPPGCDLGGPCPAVCVPCGECVDLVSECFEDSQCPAGQICFLDSWCPACVYSNPPCKAPCYAVGKCVPPEPVCKKIDPASYGLCKMLLGFGFDGKQCVSVGGCGCGDCNGIFKSLDECKKACL